MDHESLWQTYNWAAANLEQTEQLLSTELMQGCWPIIGTNMENISSSYVSYGEHGEKRHNLKTQWDFSKGEVWRTHKSDIPGYVCKRRMF